MYIERRSVSNPGSNREQVGSPMLYQLSYGTDLNSGLIPALLNSGFAHSALSLRLNKHCIEGIEVENFRSRSLHTALRRLPVERFRD